MANKETEIYDQSGNVWEWTQSRWGKSIERPDFDYGHWEQQREQRNDPEPVELRIARGGSWNNDRRNSRSATRYGDLPDNRNSTVGFRVVFSLAPSDY